MSDSSSVRDTAEAVKGIVEAVPVYQDALQPAVQEIGKALQTVVKTVHIALAPISAMVWGYEQIKDFVERQVAEKLKDVPAERIVTPPPNVAGPAIEALKYTGHDSILREMYANLLATALDADTVKKAHPAFVQIIQQLTRDEVLLLKRVSIGTRSPIADVRLSRASGGYHVIQPRFSTLGEESECDNPDMSPSYLDNLQRLGLVEMPSGVYYSADDAYKGLEEHDHVVKLREAVKGSDDFNEVDLDRYYVKLTSLGKQFMAACTG